MELDKIFSQMFPNVSKSLSCSHVLNTLCYFDYQNQILISFCSFLFSTRFSMSIKILSDFYQNPSWWYILTHSTYFLCPTPLFVPYPMEISRWDFTWIILSPFCLFSFGEVESTLMSITGIFWVTALILAGVCMPQLYSPFRAELKC